MTPLLAQHLRTDRSFERMYRRYVADVYHYALAICRNETDAEDVTQTTFMNAYRAVQAGERPRTPKNWLITIAHNVCRQRFRQAARRPSEVELDDGVAAFVPEDEGPSAGDIRRALGELAFNQRAALVMRELEGRSYAEIAEILSISVSAVETLIFRARRALREQLEGSLTCREAELALSKQLDGRLPRAEKGALRAHLRSCKECESFPRSQRAQRSALRGLAAVPLPSSLASFFGGGGAAVGSALATKAAAVTALGLLVTGAGVETAVQHPWRPHRAVRHRTAAHASPPVVAPAAAPTPAPAETRPTSDVRKPHAAAGHAKHGAAKHAATPAAQAHQPAAARAAHPAHPTHPAKQPKVQKTKQQHTRGHGRPAAAGHGKPAVPPDDGSTPTKGNGHGGGGTPPGQAKDTPAQGQPAQAQQDEIVALPLVPVPLPKPHLPKP